MLIEIISKREGFRRCGISHSVAPVVYPENRWTAEELKRLQEEPMLMVRIVPGPMADNPPAPGEGKKTDTKAGSGKGNKK